MNITLETRGFEKTRKAFRFYSKYANWEDIIQEVAWEFAQEIEKKAKEILKRKIQSRTGKLVDSIYVVADEGRIEVRSNHPAAYHLEYGSYQPKDVSVKSKTIIQYAKIYGISPWHLKVGLEKSGFFLEPVAFAYLAILDKRPKIKKRIISLAIEKKKELA
tara:strand:+ start:353 stop:835 length:483 start_codon:yes stop_codon:yes gene_type:complete